MVLCFPSSREDEKTMHGHVARTRCVPFVWPGMSGPGQTSPGLRGNRPGSGLTLATFTLHWPGCSGALVHWCSGAGHSLHCRTAWFGAGKCGEV